MEMKAQSQSRFARHAHELLDQGFHPIPLVQKRPWGGKDYGVASGWTKYCQTTPTNAEITSWATDAPRSANIGVCLGHDVGDGNILVAIDIDLVDYDEIEELKGALPSGAMGKRGAKGETLFFKMRAGDAAKTRSYRRGEQGKQETIVDFLSDGRQTVMPPSYHPDAERDYVYTQNADLRPIDMPVLTEEDIEVFEECLEAVGWDRRYRDDSSRGNIRLVVADGERPDHSIMDLNRMAMDNYPAWVEDIGAANPRWQGAKFTCVNTLRESGTGRPLSKRKRNLHFHPILGIKDFGSNQTYSPVDIVMGFLGVELDEATNWLRDRVDEIHQITRPPEPGQPDELQGLMDKGAKRAEKAAESRLPTATAREAKMEKIAKLRPFSDAAFAAAPGFIGRVAREIVHRSPSTPKTMALMTAISTISALAGRRYIGRTRRSLNLAIYGAVLVGSGGGKDFSLDFTGRLLNECAKRRDQRTMVGKWESAEQRVAAKEMDMGNPPDVVSAFELMNAPRRFTGDSAIIDQIHECAILWMRTDEFGSVLSATKNSTVNGAGLILTLLREFYSYKKSGVKMTGFAKNRQGKKSTTLMSKQMFAPFITIMGVTTPGQFFNAIDGNELEDGTINRFVLAYDEKIERGVEEIENDLFGDVETMEISPAIVDEAIDIFVGGAGLIKSGFMEGQTDPLYMETRIDVFQEVDVEIVDVTCRDARRKMAEYMHERMTSTGDPGKDDARGRVAENMFRLACLAAIADNPDREAGAKPNVSTFHVDWAIEVMSVVEQNLLSLPDEHMASREDKEFNEAERMVRKYYKAAVEKHTGTDNVKGKYVLRSILNQSFPGRHKREAQKVIDAMLKQKDADQKPMARTEGGSREGQYFYIEDVWRE